MKKFSTLFRRSSFYSLNFSLSSKPLHIRAYKPVIFQPSKFSDLSFFKKAKHSTGQCCDIMDLAPTLKTVVKRLEEFAPLSLAESWDNVGLLINPPESNNTKIKTIFFTNDLTERVLEEAIKESANLIISYHPPLFKALKKITQRTWKERIVAKCLREGIALYSPHTCWDAVSGGVNDWLAGALPSGKIKPIIPIKTYGPNKFSYKVHFDYLAPAVDPKSGLEKLEKDYFGSISINRDSNSLMRSALVTPEVLPVLLETVTDESVVSVVPLEKRYASKNGTGRLYELDKPATIQELIDGIKKHVNLPKLQVALAVNHTLADRVKKIAICAGSGASVLNGVAAQIYLTGEMSHHEVLEANHNDATVILTHHSNSERGFLKVFAQKLSEDLKKDNFVIKTIISSTDKDPLTIM